MSRVLRSVAGVFAKQWRQPSNCPACQKSFTCGAQLSGCWCGEIKLDDDLRAKLRERFSGCLCRDCLERISQQRQP